MSTLYLKNPRLNALLTLSAACLLVLTLGIGCKKNDPDVPSTSSSIQGNWRLTTVNVSPVYTYYGTPVAELVTPLNTLESNCVGSTTVMFNSNGTVTNNATSTSACTNASISKQLISTFFGSSVSYTETDNQLSVRGPQPFTASKTLTGGTATLVTSLSVNPGGQATPTSYTIVLTKL